MTWEHVGLTLGSFASSAAERVASTHRASSPKDAAELEKVALQFEEIMVRQLLQPLEKSLTQSMGESGGSHMIGGMITNSLSQSITQGGGLGLAAVIEEALRGTSSEPVSPDVVPEKSQPEEEG